MKRKLALLIAALCAMHHAMGITLQECYDAAEAHYPQVADYGIIDRMESLTLDNISKAWLPQATLSAKASWQTETTALPIDFSKMGISGVDVPSMRNDQYGLTLDVTQTIWDGGSTQASKATATASSEVRRQSLHVSTYALRSRVNQLYFGILLADDYLRLNDALLADLEIVLGRVESCIEHGVANQADADALRVEQVKARQQRTVYENNRAAYVDMLSTLTGLDLSDHSDFEVPEYAMSASEIRRPELSLFDSRMHSSRAALSTLKADLMPRLSAFVTGGYGSPGLDMFQRSFSPYAIVGIRGSWNIGAYYTNANKRRLIEADIASIETEKETFLFNTTLDLAMTDKDAKAWRDQLKYDDEIIALQQSIVAADEAKLAAGVITGTDLARDINSVHTSRLSKAMHHTQLLLNSYQRKFITN